jgi:hypothetical protein
VTARSRYYDINRLQLYNEQDVSIVLHRGGSFDEIGRLFTDDASQTVTLPARAAFGFHANLDFDEMRTLHTFPVDGADDCAQQPNAPGAMLSPWLKPWWGLLTPSARLAG